jgi:DNA (cytosine-5)-methyltransferase 1
LRYLSVCSGIEAATVAWHPLGWAPVAFSEIEPFPSAVLAHHYPAISNVGDMTKFQDWRFDESVELLVRGTPCQSFSVAGLRKGMADPRGNLALVYLGIADKFRPKWIVWENVPGVLSSNGGRDFGSLLGALAELGYGFAYRVLDAQFFGVAQRRRRVFVVGYLGDWRRAAAVLFERDSLRRDTAPSREAGQKPAPTVVQSPPYSRTGNERVECEAIVAQCLTAGTGQRYDFETETILPIALAKNTIGRQPQNSDCNERQTPVLQLMPFGVGESPDTAHCLRSGASKADKHESTAYVAQPIDFRNLRYHDGDVSGTMQSKASGGYSLNYMTGVQQHMAVRRLTPVECERLQGFPDNYTNIPWRKSPESPDGPRYKALGNSMAVPVMAWIGKRIAMVEGIPANDNTPPAANDNWEQK